jgi:hypothetical protein
MKNIYGISAIIMSGILPVFLFCETATAQINGQCMQTLRESGISTIEAIERCQSSKFTIASDNQLAKNDLISIQFQQGGTLARIFFDYYLKSGHTDPVWASRNINLNKDIYVAEFDFNDDGQKEIIGRVENPGVCGSGGCDITIIQQSNGQWREIFNGLGVIEISRYRYKTNGYYDLIHPWSGGYYAYLAFNGREYEPLLIADGTLDRPRYGESILCENKGTMLAFITPEYNVAICKAYEDEYYYISQNKQDYSQIFLPITERNNPYDGANPWLLKAHNGEFTYQVAEFNPLSADSYVSISIFRNGNRIYHRNRISDNYITSGEGEGE